MLSAESGTVAPQADRYIREEWEMPNESMQGQPPPGFKLRHTLRGHESLISRIAWSPDGRFLASSSFDETIRLWDGDRGTVPDARMVHWLDLQCGVVAGRADACLGLQRSHHPALGSPDGTAGGRS